MRKKRLKTISIIHDPTLAYPTLKKTADGLLGIQNPIYPVIKKLLGQVQNDSRAKSDILGEYISPGMKVFILCNFVYHRRKKEKETDFYGKCTHGSIVAAVAQICSQLVGNQGIVYIGNAPLQSCDFASVLRDTGADIIGEQARKNGLNIVFRDLRTYIVRQTKLGNLIVLKDSSYDMDKIVEVDLGRHSLLNNIEQPNNYLPKFRVTDYNPAIMDSYHDNTLKSHRYLVHKDILNADVIISIPKMKTHEKVGVTLGMKGYVGTIASKECLAHYRYGPAIMGGDEYPSPNILNLLGTRLNEYTFKQNYPLYLLYLFQIIDRAYKKLLRISGKPIDGAWFGNDTA